MRDCPSAAHGTPQDPYGCYEQDRAESYRTERAVARAKESVTDDDILAMADQLISELALTEDDRDVIVLRVQRLVWPPNPHYFLHDRPHVVIDIGQRVDAGWGGRISCPGCARRWTVEQGPSEEAVHGALTAAHEEYRSGRATAVPAPGTGRRVSLDTLLRRAEYVQVTDERWTGH